MTRRALLIALIVAVLPQGASADDAGARRRQRDTALCRARGRAYERRGLTRREAARLAERGCVKVGGEWVSSRVYQG